MDGSIAARATGEPTTTGEASILDDGTPVLHPGTSSIIRTFSSLSSVDPFDGKEVEKMSREQILKLTRDAHTQVFEQRDDGKSGRSKLESSMRAAS